MSWLVVFAVVLLFLLLPVRIHAEYNKEALVQLLIGPVRLMLYPRKAKKPKTERSGKKEKSDSDFESHETQNRKSSMSLSDLLEIVQVIIDFLRDIKRKLIVTDLQLHVLLAGEDPCDVAVNYGRALAALGNLMPQMERHFVIKNRDLHVSCDFSADKTMVNAKIILSVRLGDILWIVVYHGIRVLRKYLKNINKSKAVQ